VAEAGLDAVAHIKRAVAGSNENFVVTVGSGARVVLRRYEQQLEPHTALARLRRERWALQTLRAVGAPVGGVLASCEEPGREALLLEFVEGELLGSLAARLPAADAAPAWTAAGRAFAAVHAVEGARAAAAGCKLAGIRAPETSRGPYHQQETIENLRRLGRSRPDLRSLWPLRAIVERAGPLYEKAPLALAQSDAHLWQFAVAERGGGWECTAILDWEHVDLDDPDWDLAQLDVFRFAPVAETPKAFFAGYGRTPTSPLYLLYRLERAAWVLDAHVRGEAWVALSLPLAESFVAALLDRPDPLGDAVDLALATL
jgi:aminoglycoside phosphotransferase (APT) family kinase protein